MNFSANYKKILGRTAVCLGIAALLGGCAAQPHEHPEYQVNVQAVNSATAKAEAAAMSAGAAAKSAEAAAGKAEAAAGKAGDAAAKAEAAAAKAGDAATRAEAAAAKAEAMFEKSMTK